MTHEDRAMRMIEHLKSKECGDFTEQGQFEEYFKNLLIVNFREIEAVVREKFEI